MTHLKSYTSLEQSKELSKILPLESADMLWEQHFIDKPYVTVNPWNTRGKSIGGLIVPCWSLAALLDVLPKKYYPVKDHETDLIIGKPKNKWCVLYWDTTGLQDGEQTLGDNPIDACYEMILKLHEQKLL